ncbi:FAD/NAD(P)-binding protein [Streptomyces syringium]|uniref:FAD/NAD(P)-binding protein n=1 Tax=Streptomyces syringium TaxID=76729 RepID=UPI0036E15BEB
MQRIAIVGAGAAGACMVESIARTVRETCALTVVDGGPHLWRGRAYQPDESGVLTNIHAAHMSLRESDPSHALRWLTGRCPGAVDGDGLTSRALYGAYLDDTVSRAWHRLAGRGWRLRTVREHATRVVPEGRRVAVATAGGGYARFDHVVLCTGPTEPADPYRLGGAGRRYVADPFPLARTLAGLPDGGPVGILGSGLTALDIVAALVGRDDRSAITLVSRSGILPAVRTPSAVRRPRYLTLARLEALTAAGRPLRSADLLALVRAELRAAGSGESGLRRELAVTEPPSVRLRRQLHDGRPDDGLGVLRQALHHFAGHAWNLLPDEEKTALWQCYSRALTSLCCPMPRHRAALLLELMDSGRLRVLSGVSAIERNARGGFDITAGGAVTGVGTLFNALNPAAPATVGLSAIESYVTRRTGAGHPLGGLRTERRTHRVLGAHGGCPGLYALGHPTRGSVLFHFGIPSLVYQSGLVARAIAAATDAGARPGGRRHRTALSAAGG